jgi:succinate dehydrogenase cytochrome b556 subunit
MFVWIFHRVSGVLLIFLVAVQLATGLVQASTANAAWLQTMAELHKQPTLNCLMVFLFTFHALYGIRTILLDVGVRAERLLFWACTIAGVVLYGAFLVLFLTLVRA